MINHAYNQSDLPVNLQILNISVNMGRVGTWLVNLPNLVKEHGDEAYKSRLELIKKINNQTESYLDDLESQKLSKNFKETLTKVKNDLKRLKNEDITNNNHLYWAERVMTWADILQIKAKLA